MRIDVFDVDGRRVRVHHDGQRSQGRHELKWNGLTDNGAPLAAGLYFLRLETQATFASGAAGVDHFPLTEGVVNQYEYSTQQTGGTYITYFSGTADVGGTTTHVLHYEGDGHDGLLHFWSEAAAGHKLRHGSHWVGFGTPLIFSPPIPMIDEPLYLGKTWVVDSRDSDHDTR